MNNPLATLSRAINSVSPHTAAWGPHLLTRAGAAGSIVSSGLWDGALTYTRAANVEQEETTEGENPLAKKGDRPTSFSVTVTANRLAGLNPLLLYKTWEADLGKSRYFFIGLLPLSADLYILQNVSLRFRGRDCDADGAPIIATITLQFTADTVLGRIGKNEQTANPSAADPTPTAGANSGIKTAAKAALNR